MELYKMLYQRLTGNTAINAMLAKYNNRPAVFYQRAPTADNAKWGNPQYPRIDYIVDMQENPARNTSGVLTVNIWCDTEHGDEPEDIEVNVRELLHAVFAQADDTPYCFAWTRSDAFEVRNEKEQSARTIGTTMIFDIMACPSHFTMYPDPIKALNTWTKAAIPDAIVIGTDEMEGWVIPTRETPIVYWRLAAHGAQQKHFTHTWLSVGIEGHVYAPDAADRLYNLAKISAAEARAGHIPMEDDSPLFLTGFTVRPHLNYLSQGQIQAQGRYGILQEWYGVAPDPTLNHINIPRDTVYAEETTEVDTDATPYTFPYEPAGTEETGDE